MSIGQIVKLDRWKSTIANFAQPDEREDSGAGLRPIDAPAPKNVRKLTSQPSAASLVECPTPVATISNIMSSLWPSSDSLGATDDKRRALVQDDSDSHHGGEGTRLAPSILAYEGRSTNFSYIHIYSYICDMYSFTCLYIDSLQHVRCSLLLCGVLY
jgi:hypothetical protein